MTTAPSNRNIIKDILEGLEDHDVDLDNTPLYQYVDPEALQQVVTSLDDEFEITFLVETIRVTVTPDGVLIRNTGENPRLSRG